jgi:hypothetical protein
MGPFFTPSPLPAPPRLRISGAVINGDGHHEMSGLGDTCEPVHNAADSGEPVCPHQRLDGPRWLRRTKGLIKQRSSIMSKYTTFKFVPVIGAVLAFAITAAEPAHAARNNACATARAIFKAQMSEARFWIGVADQFAAAGNEANANLASNEANFFLGQAEAALNAMSEAC